MKRFANLFAEIDSTTRTNAKVEAMSRYFADANAADAAWAVYFLTGGRPKRLVPASLSAGDSRSFPHSAVLQDWPMSSPVRDRPFTL